MTRFTPPRSSMHYVRSWKPNMTADWSLTGTR